MGDIEKEFNSKLAGDTEIDQEDPGEEVLEGEETKWWEFWEQSPTLHGDSSRPSKNDIEIIGGCPFN